MICCKGGRERESDRISSTYRILEFLIIIKLSHPLRIQSKLEPNKAHFGDNIIIINSAVLSLIERLSSSRRFSMNI